MTPAQKARAEQLERDMATITSGPHSKLAAGLIAKGWHK